MHYLRRQELFFTFFHPGSEFIFCATQKRRDSAKRFMNGVPDTKTVSHRDIRHGRRTWGDGIGVPGFFVLGLFTDRLS